MKKFTCHWVIRVFTISKRMIVNRLEEQKFYRVEYEGDVYTVEKLPDGKIVFYEVVE
jgi:hypothetical protein